MAMLQGKTTAIGKILSANDTGATASHQVGIYIPKDPHILDFFPNLSASQSNPSQTMRFIWDSDNTEYDFRFIYYNGKLHGTSTRDEYRLTQMTGFFRDSGLQPGDTIVLYRDGADYYVSDHAPMGGVVPADQNWAVVM